MSKKPWRTFRKERKNPFKSWVLKAGAAVFILGAAFLWKEGRLPARNVFSLWRQDKMWHEREAAEGEESQEGLLEEVFGIRVRIQEGTIEFYRKERKMESD